MLLHNEESLDTCPRLTLKVMQTVRLFVLLLFFRYIYVSCTDHPPFLKQLQENSAVGISCQK